MCKRAGSEVFRFGMTSFWGELSGIPFRSSSLLRRFLPTLRDAELLCSGGRLRSFYQTPAGLVLQVTPGQCRH